MPGDPGATSGLFEPVFTTDELSAATGGRAWLQAMLDAEAALAAAGADAGIVPDEAAAAIAGCCVADRFDTGALGRAARPGGNPVIPLVTALTAAVPAGARDWVHRGATSQDILDTAAMLVTRSALDLIGVDVRRLAGAAAALADAHRDTLMVGRTLLQPALPVPFGLKAAGWLVATIDAGRALDGLRPRLAVQLGGAAGTLAALGDHGIDVVQAMARRLDLAVPVLPWHTARQRVAEIAGALGTLAGTAGKIALDVVLLMQHEVGEASEPAAGGRGGSSTMPHKRNPVLGTEALAAARRAHGLVPVLLGATIAEHERPAGAWHTEWEALGELLRLSGGAVNRAADIVGGLGIDADRMAANLERAGPLLAERVALALAPVIGRVEAARRVGDAAARATASGRDLADELATDTVLAAHLDTADLAALLDAGGYVGSSHSLIDRALQEYRRFSRAPNQLVPEGAGSPRSAAQCETGRAGSREAEG